MNVLNEKFITQLKHYDEHDIVQLLVFLCTRVWKILNIKGIEAWKHLNDHDRDKIKSKTDKTQDFLLKVASAIKFMHSGKRGAKIRVLTGHTANAFHRTLHAMVYIIRNF